MNLELSTTSRRCLKPTPVVVPGQPRLRFKWQRILAIFVTGRSLNMFEGEREGDHALHSTVAGLQARGLTIHRKEETVRGYMGAPTRVCRYWLASESFERARELLGLPAGCVTTDAYRHG